MTVCECKYVYVLGHRADFEFVRYGLSMYRGPVTSDAHRQRTALQMIKTYIALKACMYSASPTWISTSSPEI
jgi:hypothetical protein